MSKSEHGLKIDKALQKHLPTVSRRSIRRALDSNEVFLNKQVVRFASSTVKTGDLVEIKITAQKKEVAPQTGPDFILYEDEFILAINKPPFVPSQKIKNSKTLCAKELLIKHLKEQKKTYEHELILCHRLDKETSGILLFAKSQKACDWIMSQFKERECQKTYLALSFGVSKKESWKQKNNLGTLNNKEQKVKIVHSGGKTAITNFKVLKSSQTKKISLIECKPLTGRTHQIRVQLSHSGLPILGDKKYFSHFPSGKSFNIPEHHLLHAKSLKIKPFEGASFIEIEAPLSPLFKKHQKSL